VGVPMSAVATVVPVILGWLGVVSLLVVSQFFSHEYLRVARFLGRLTIHNATLLIPLGQRRFRRAE
jgi:hypothetical protein